MPDGKVVLALALAAAVVYGGKALGTGTVAVAKKTAAVVSHPFRHPKQDTKAVARAVVHPKILDK